MNEAKLLCIEALILETEEIIGDFKKIIVSLDSITDKENNLANWISCIVSIKAIQNSSFEEYISQTKYYNERERFIMKLAWNWRLNNERIS